MAGERFVAITRDDFEGWLDSFAKRAPYEGWVRDTTTAGAYTVKFSEHVGVKIFTTLSRRDEVVSVGEASTNMYLVCVHDGRALNRKAAPQRFYRTKGWQTTWKTKGVDWWYQTIYIPAKDFYETVGQVKDREAYRREWVAKIESIPSWETNTFLQDLRTRVMGGDILTPKMIAAVEQEKQRSSTREPDLSPEQKAFLEKLRRLEKTAQGDEWTTTFIRDIISRIERQGASARLSDKQKDVIRDKLRQYRVASGDVIPMLHLMRHL